MPCRVSRGLGISVTEKSLFFSDFLEEEDGEDPEDEAIAVGSRRANASRPSHAPLPSQKTSAPTPVTREGEEEEEEEAEEGNVLGFRSRERREGSTREPPERRDGLLREQQQEAEVLGVRLPSAPFTRSLTWVHTAPAQPSRRGGAETPPKLSKSALLFPHKSSLSAMTSKARQVISNSAIKGHAPAKLRPNKEKRKEESKVYITRPRPSGGRRGITPRLPREVFPGVFLYQNGKSTKLVNLGTARQLWPKSPLRLSRTSPRRAGPGLEAELGRLAHRRRKEPQRGRREGRRGTVTSTPNRGDPPPSTPSAPPTGLGLTPPTDTRVTSYIRTSEVSTSLGQEDMRGAGPEEEEEEGGVSNYSYEEAEPRPGWAEDGINWQRTFSVNSVDFELLRSDWNDLRCNVSGNLQLAESEAVELLAQYMEKLNERNGG